MQYFDTYGYIRKVGDKPFDFDATVIAFIDESADYEIDQTAILREDGGFLLATASGCSCWSGEWHVERYNTLDDLFASLQATDRRYGPTLMGIIDLMVQAANAQTS